MHDADLPGTPLSISPLLQRIEPILLAQGTPVFLVGGAVRDALLDLSHGDLDFVVSHNAIKLAFRVADALGAPAYALDRQRDVGRVVLSAEQTTLDFARMRGGSIENDLRDRDFTINAMALPVGARSRSALLDPCGGQRDIARRRIRQTHPDAIIADPVRALRALRLGNRFDFRLAAGVEAAIRAANDGYQRISPERIRDELLKLLMSATPHVAVQQMAALDILATLLPEVAATAGVEQSAPHHEPVLAHTCTVLFRLVQVEAILFGKPTGSEMLAPVAAMLEPYRLDLKRYLARPVDGGLTGRILLRLGALFHDVGKPATKVVEADGRIRFFDHSRVGAKLAQQRLRHLHLSNEACAAVQRIVAEHMRPLYLAREPLLTRRAIYRYFRNCGAQGLDVALLSLADCLATYEAPQESQACPALLERVARLFEHYFQKYEESVSPEPLLKGGELIAALDMTPGPEVGRLMRLIEEAQAAGEIESLEEALLLAQRSVKERE